MKNFSGIPVKDLLDNNEKLDSLNLCNSWCGQPEALMLSRCLKVVVVLLGR